MDLKIKKFYTDQEGGGSTVERKLIVDSKFRRETSNFKVIFDASNVDLASEDPVLIKYIEKNLKPEELLGLVTSFTQSTPNQPTEIDTDIIIAVEATIDPTDNFEWYALSTMTRSAWLFYVPSTGALSLNRPYVEEEEGVPADASNLPNFPASPTIGGNVGGDPGVTDHN